MRLIPVFVTPARQDGLHRTQPLLIRRSLAALVLATALVLTVGARPSHASVLQIWKTPSKHVPISYVQPRDRYEGTLGTRVLLPDDYGSRPCWPVLYLLHGTGTDTTPAQTEWIDQLHADQLNLPAIVVIPGGGPMWWVDAWLSGKRASGFESWMLRELVPTVTKRLHVCADRSQHAVAGYSMGGYGAVYLGSQRPDYFGSIGSFSGVLAPQRPEFQTLFKDFPTYWGPASGFYANGHDPMQLAANLRSSRVLVENGNGNPIGSEVITPGARLEELEFGSMGQDFVKVAKKSGVRVKFDLHAGGHTWPTWQEDLRRFMAWGPFAPVPKRPAKWTLATSMQAGTVWDYTYRLSAAPTSALRFTYAKGALTVEGEGTIALLTRSGTRVHGTLPFVLHGTKVTHLSGHRKLPLQGSGQKQTPITIAPKRLGGTKAITVSFVAPKELPATMEYEIGLITTSAGCSQTVTVRVPGVPKGATVRATLRPDGDPGHPRTTWCHAQAVIGALAVDKGTAGFQLGGYLGHKQVQLH
jgi:S-formylglutathione hydrolase FrmB